MLPVHKLDREPSQPPHDSELKCMTQSTRPRLDKYDIAILAALADDYRIPTMRLADLIHLSRTATARRLEILRESGVLKTAAEVVDLQRMGLEVHALVELRASHPPPDRLARQLLAYPEVSSVRIVSGEGVLVLEVLTRDADQLRLFLKAMQGIGTTATRLIFEEIKSDMPLSRRLNAMET